MTKLFLDANVIFAATCSKKGGSRAIFELAKVKKLAIVSSGYALLEARLNISRKGSAEMLPTLYQLISLFSHVDNKSGFEQVADKYAPLIVQKDLPILTSAISQKVDFLITLDRKDFQTEKLKKANLPFSILSPGEFLQNT